ncbi:MAG: alpha/beta hydrolase [Pseudomonadota bacterium]
MTEKSMVTIGYRASEQAEALIHHLADQPIYLPERETGAANRLKLRRANTPAVERAVAHYGVTYKVVRFAQVPCLEIVPQDPSHCIDPSDGKDLHNQRIILYCFGGGYHAGSAFEDLVISAALAALTGARVIAPDYRLAPEHPYPAALEDAMAVYQTIHQEHAPRRIAVVGESAGGNLALALLQRAAQEGLGQPACLALLSPWCDLTSSGDSHTFNEGRDPTLNNRYAAAAAALYAGERRPSDPAISPLFGRFDQGFPCTMITSATRDLLLSQCIGLAARLRDANVEVDLRIWDGLWHVFEFYDEIPEAEASLQQIANFIAKRF